MDMMVEHASAQTGTCPVAPHGVQPTDMLVLLSPKRMVTQYSVNDDGQKELNLYYGDKQVTFDDPAYFAFGETLARQDRFRADAAVTWGVDHDWDDIAGLLEQLIDAGVLSHESAVDAVETCPADRTVASPLPEASLKIARTWDDCEAITEELTGVAVEKAYLELIVPVFRVAHMALDQDGRQVGEANVFPRAMRLDVATDWMTCIYPGTRYMVDRPMNVSALKGMRTHWDEMMASLLVIRDHFFKRFPEAKNGWTIGHIERLATLVLAVPTYQLVKPCGKVDNGDLHPALSSLFRVTDGLRMVMHQMLFVPIGEPTLPPDTPMTVAEILAYAERNYSFHSETGVCAGPKIMVEDFLTVLLTGEAADRQKSFEFSPAVSTALQDIELAFDYGLHGLRAHAALFAFWPAMARSYEAIFNLAIEASASGLSAFEPLAERFADRMTDLRTRTFLSSEDWRVEREKTYADMYDNCGKALYSRNTRPGLIDSLQAARMDVPDKSADRLLRHLTQKFATSAKSRLIVMRLAAALSDCAMSLQAILSVALESQNEVNLLLRRQKPIYPFGVREMNVHNLLQGSERPRLPYLFDELSEALGIEFVLEPGTIKILQSAAVKAERL